MDVHFLRKYWCTYENVYLVVKDSYLLKYSHIFDCMHNQRLQHIGYQTQAFRRLIYLWNNFHNFQIAQQLLNFGEYSGNIFRFQKNSNRRVIRDSVFSINKPVSQLLC